MQIVTDAPESEGLFPESVRTFRFVSLLAVPLKVKKKVIGLAILD